jgi:NAD(P)-dependent dehydrogenase (short-subunit alcohol dehydrogenase family)
MTPPKFLITGATGATGGNAARKLLEKAHSVRVLAHRPDERSEQLRKICRGQAVRDPAGGTFFFKKLAQLDLGVGRSTSRFSEKIDHRLRLCKVPTVHVSDPAKAHFILGTFGATHQRTPDE